MTTGFTLTATWDASAAPDAGALAALADALQRITAGALPTARTSVELAAPEPSSDGPLVIDEAARQVRVGGAVVALTLKEFDLLACLARHRGRVLSRTQVLQQVWGWHWVDSSRTVDVHVTRLRRKLGPAGGALVTVRGVGYRLAPELLNGNPR
jgi:DNA-binding response OmpR family regulator